MTRRAELAILVFFGALWPGATALAQAQMTGQVPLGAEAAGMGGAYTAVSRDSSAVIYNPAGLGFLTTKSQSNSYNAYSTLTVQIDHLFLGANYTATRQATPFFAGSTYRGPDLAPDWSFGGAFFESAGYSSNTRWTASGPFTFAFNSLNPQAVQTNYAQTNKEDLSVIHMVGAAARKLGDDFAVGFSLGAARLQYSDLSSSKSTYGPIDYTTVGGPASVFSNSLDNDNQNSNGLGVDLGAGLMWKVTPRFSIGLSVQSTFYVSQHATDIADNASFTTDAYGNSIAFGGGQVEETQTNDLRPFGVTPLLGRVGVAYAFGSEAVVAADVTLSSPSPAGVFNDRQHLTANAAIGGTLALSDRWDLRGGVYTAIDPEHAESTRGLGQGGDFLDLYSVCGSLVLRTKSFDVGAVGTYQDAVGRSQSTSAGATSPDGSLAYHGSGYTVGLTITSIE